MVERNEASAPFYDKQRWHYTGITGDFRLVKVISLHKDKSNSGLLGE
ncbi:hypothetical protein [Sporomusa acidovorans]|nr:hypothetical protein [Sporomusa acidovorans]